MVAVIKVTAKELNERLLKQIRRLAGQEKNAAVTISIERSANPSKEELKELKTWRDAGAIHFLNQYSNEEPEYFEADIQEPNPEYKPWKKAK